MSLPRVFLCLMAATATLAACSSTPPAPTVATTAPATATSTTAATPVAVETDAQKLERIVKTLAKNSIYFDYDNYEIKAEYQPALKADFEALKAAPKQKFMVEGNADERGSTEYNLALGQKRAEAVKHALLVLGVPEAQLEAVSFGKEKPRADCHEEKCWAENRRVDLARGKP